MTPQERVRRVEAILALHGALLAGLDGRLSRAGALLAAAGQGILGSLHLARVGLTGEGLRLELAQLGALQAGHRGGVAWQRHTEKIRLVGRLYSIASGTHGPDAFGSWGRSHP